VTSEATPIETPEVSADAMQASQASEAVSGDFANVASDMPEEVSSITPVETVTPPDPTVAKETVEQEMPAEAMPHELPETAEAQEAINQIEPAETAEAVQPPAPEPLTEVQPVETVKQAAEVSPVELPEIMPPVDLETPAVEAEDTPKIAALTTPVEVVEAKPRVSEVARVAPKPVKAIEKRKPAKQAQAKPAKTKAAAKPKSQRQMVAGSRESKVAKHEGKSTAKHSGGRMASSAYRSIVQARLSARKTALQSTASRGLKGYVIVSFSIGASGTVTRASVSKSSGNGAVDSAARAMVASTSFPPPPGGSFSARLPVMVK
jgi:protein TonB